jgi:SAM-dependent methyltransferase
VTYPFDQAWQGERARLLALERLFDTTTHAHLVDLGVSGGWHCLEVGAGAGSIARWLAERVGPTGRVLATDSDIRFVEPAANLEIRRHDIAHDDLPRNAFDLVHARLVLAYVEKPEHALQRIIEAVRPGGWLLVEEADHGVMPTRAGYVDPIEYRDLFSRISDAYIGLINAGGGDPEFGAALPQLLFAGGLTDVGATAHIPFMFGGIEPHVARLTLETLGDTMVGMGLLTAADVAEYLALSNRPGMWQALVPCVSAWGRRPTDADARHLDDAGEYRR